MKAGGDSAGGKKALRQGMDALLGPIKAMASDRGWRWKLVLCGGRHRAFRAYSKAVGANEYAIVVLLVDSEVPVSATPVRHLEQQDNWRLASAPTDSVHLMVQVMEAWILADGDALRGYYGAGLRLAALPRRRNLEDVAKTDVLRALAQATSGTSKGDYRKIRHASELLALLDPNVVRQRCPHFGRMWDWLQGRVQA